MKHFDQNSDGQITREAGIKTPYGLDSVWLPATFVPSIMFHTVHVCAKPRAKPRTSYCQRFG